MPVQILLCLQNEIVLCFFAFGVSKSQNACFVLGAGLCASAWTGAKAVCALRPQPVLCQQLTLKAREMLAPMACLPGAFF